MSDTIFTIPSKLKVGYKSQEITTNGNLGYVIHYNIKTGLLTSAKSFESWRDKNIETNDFDNKPTSGFIFSRSISRSGFYRGSKIEKVRVYDPRGFDVEISISNLMEIIEQFDIEKSEIKGELVYGWSFGRMSLIPATSNVYNQSVEVSSQLSVKFSLKDLVIGGIYECVDGSNLKPINMIYIGRFNVNSSINEYSSFKSLKTTRHYSDLGGKHIFLNKDSYFDNEKYRIVNPKNVLRNIGSISDLEVNEEIINFAENFKTIKFDNKIYLNVFKKGIFKDIYEYEKNLGRKIKDFRGLSIAYKDFICSGDEFLSEEKVGVNIKDLQYHWIGTNSDFNKQLILKIGDNEPNISNSIISMLDVLSDFSASGTRLSVNKTSALVCTAFYSFLMSNPNLITDVGVLRTQFNCLKFDADYDYLIESDDFKKHMLLSISEFFENVDVFYLSALRDKDNGNFHCFREKESSDDFIASSFFVADIDGLNTVWRKELNNSGDVYLDNERLCQRNMLYLLKCYTF